MSNDNTTDAIIDRLNEAAAAIERSSRRTGKSFRNLYRGTSASAESVVEREWDALKRDLADLTSRTDLAANPEVKAIVDRLRASVAAASDSVAEAASSARRQALEGADAVDGYVRESPWRTAGIAVLAGMAVGLLIARR